jgi:hypothetical protein
MRLTVIGSCLFLLAMVFGGIRCTCNPVATSANSDFFSFLRDDLALACCNCLASATIDVPDRLFQCQTGDGGILSDGGQGQGADLQESTCLCGEDATSCRELLNNGGELALQGACVQENGPCGIECDGVLAYP